VLNGGDVSKYSDLEEYLNKDESFYFYPTNIEIMGDFRIWCSLPGTCDLTLSDVTVKSKSMILIEYNDEDDDRPAEVSLFEADSTIASMVSFLRNMDSVYHETIYRAVFEWAIRAFFVSAR